MVTTDSRYILLNYHQSLAITNPNVKQTSREKLPSRLILLAGHYYIFPYGFPIPWTCSYHLSCPSLTFPEILNF